MSKKVEPNKELLEAIEVMTPEALIAFSKLTGYTTTEEERQRE